MSNVFFNGEQVIDVVDRAGLGSYSKKSREEMEVQYGKLQIISLDDACLMMEQRACSLPVEVTIDEWDEALGVLPPLRWRRETSIESFRICEAMMGSVHTAYVRLNKRYFCMNRPLSDTHEDLVTLATTAMLTRSKH